MSRVNSRCILTRPVKGRDHTVTILAFKAVNAILAGSFFLFFCFFFVVVVVVVCVCMCMCVCVCVDNLTSVGERGGIHGNVTGRTIEGLYLDGGFLSLGSG